MTTDAKHNRLNINTTSVFYKNFTIEDVRSHRWSRGRRHERCAHAQNCTEDNFRANSDVMSRLNHIG